MIFVVAVVGNILEPRWKLEIGRERRFPGHDEVVEAVALDRLDAGAVGVAHVRKNPLLIRRTDRKEDGGTLDLLATVARAFGGLA